MAEELGSEYDDDESSVTSSSSTEGLRGNMISSSEGGHGEEKQPASTASTQASKEHDNTEDEGASNGNGNGGGRRLGERTSSVHRLSLSTAHAAVNPHNNKNLLQGEVMLQYLPIAVCQFDIHGELRYQNPEALHIFGWPDKSSKKRKGGSTAMVTSAGSGNSKESSSIETIVEGMSIADDGSENDATTDKATDGSQQKSQFEEVDGQNTTPTTPTANGDNHRNTNDYYDNDFVNRFVDKQEGIKLYEQIKSGKDVNVEALVHTKRGPGWNAIHARLGKPLGGGGEGSRGTKNAARKNRKRRRRNKGKTGGSDGATQGNHADEDRRMILFSARDISEIITAKREMQLSLERSEFFAIMVSPFLLQFCDGLGSYSAVSPSSSLAFYLFLTLTDPCLVFRSHLVRPTIVSKIVRSDATTGA